MHNFMNKLNNVSIIAGYKNSADLILKFVLPVFATTLIIGIGLAFIPAIPILVSITIPVFGLIAVFGYPYSRYSQLENDINKHMHFFITYAGTISTMKISRGQLFKRIAEKKVFGEISSVFGKILYLAKGWNLGFAKSCRAMSLRSPSQILRDFLDRFAVIMDFGQDLEVFLLDEQKAVLDDFSVEYQKSLEKIKLLQDVFISFAVAFSFIIAIALLAPLLMDIEIGTVLMYAMSAFLIVEFLIVISISSFIPQDKLFHDSKEKNEPEKRMYIWFFFTSIISMAILFMLLVFSEISFLFIFAISIMPLLIPGIIAYMEENLVIRRDRQFPVYARVLGSAIDVRGGGVVSALKSTQVHDFGVLNEMSLNLYKRLKLGCDKFRSWYYFALESSSNLIMHFSKIFSESVYLGGDAGKIGEIVSKNMLRIISMRKLRYQLSQGLRAAFYSSLIGLTATMYVTAEISSMLIQIFNAPGGMEDNMFSFINSVMPHAMSVDFSGVMLMMGILIIAHSAASAIVMKVIDGGTMYAALVDFIIMIWIGAALAYFLPGIVGNILPDFSGIWVDSTP